MSSDTFASLLGNVWSIFLIVLFFGGSIFVHELGHFLAARRRGLKVTRFSIGMGPAIWSHRGKDGVEYRLAWIPIGGYVLLPQLADMPAIEGEAETEDAKLPPITYTTKVIVLVAGAFFNILFAFFLASILWVVGQPVVEEEQTTRVGFVHKTIELPNGKQAEGPAYRAGLESGDIILSVDGKTVKTLNDIGQLVVLGGGRSASGKPSVEIEFEHKGEHRRATLIPELVGAEEYREIGIEPAAKVTIAGVQPGLPAETAGLKKYDIITQIDGQDVGYVGFISDYLKANGGKPVKVTYLRENKAAEVTLSPLKIKDPETKADVYRLGVQLKGALTLKTIRTPPWEQVWDKAVWTWRTLQSVISPSSNIGLSKMSGPLGIADKVHQFAQVDIRLLLWFVIFINVNLAIFNLLPIPVLDGGHVAFATLAKLRGKDLPLNVIATIQSVFVVLLLSMMAYVTIFGDLPRMARESRESKAAAQAREAAAEQQKKDKPAEPAKP
jgi:regulator of sigma E protease